MNARKLLAEYLITAEKLYGNTFWAMYNFIILLFVAFLASLVIDMSAIIVGNSVFASSQFIMNYILVPLFNFAVLFQAINISLGVILPSSGVVVRVE